LTTEAVQKWVPLGTTDIRVSPLGLGAWSWGDRFFWGYGRGYTAGDVREAFDVSLAAGVNFIDTAESYGRGRSEQLLGEFLRSTGETAIVATKFMPYPWRLSKGQLLSALKGSLRRLGLSRVDLYQIHWPFPPVSIETWMDALAEAVAQGLTRAVGVSNYNTDQMMRASEALDKHGLRLATNQVDYSLLNRRVEREGLLDLCKRLGITLIAYSPLAQGVLTGKYTPENPPPGIRGLRYREDLLRRAQPLVGLMEEIGEAHGGRSPAQVALNWTICKGSLTIPGAKNARQAQENAGALGWQLDEPEVNALDEASQAVMA
jgi:aryl-alcohol dehydrogenase-like predicted oxidoreductase